MESAEHPALTDAELDAIMAAREARAVREREAAAKAPDAAAEEDEERERDEPFFDGFVVEAAPWANSPQRAGRQFLKRLNPNGLVWGSHCGTHTFVARHQPAAPFYV